MAIDGNVMTLYKSKTELNTVVLLYLPNTVKSRSLLRIALLPDGTLKIANVTKRDAASYTCIAKNQFGTASTTGRLIVTGKSGLKVESLSVN